MPGYGRTEPLERGEEGGSETRGVDDACEHHANMSLNTPLAGSLCISLDIFASVANGSCEWGAMHPCAHCVLHAICRERRRVCKVLVRSFLGMGAKVVTRHCWYGNDRPPQSLKGGPAKPP